MRKPSLLFAGFFFLLFMAPSVDAQDYSPLGQNSEKRKKVVVSTLPSDFFTAEHPVPETTEKNEESVTAVNNLWVIAGFGAMLMIGSSITAYSMARRRPRRKPTRIGLTIHS